jgi:hypothetical protein
VGWSAWQLIAPGTFTSLIGTAYEADKNTIEIFTNGTDGNPYHAYYTTGAANGWSGWSRLGS